MPDLFVANKKTEKPVEDKVKDKIKLPSTKHAHMFCSFCVNPDKIYFNTQDSDETILLFIRRHFITNASWIIVSLIFLLLPLILIYLNNFLHFFTNDVSFQYLIVGFISYYLLIFTYIFINFITWYFNIALITNKRIVDVDFSDLVYKNVAETKLSLVQDVSYTQIGAIGSLFNYGNILVQTAGSIDNFELPNSPNPQKIVDIIENLIGKENHAV